MGTMQNAGTKNRPKKSLEKKMGRPPQRPPGLGFSGYKKSGYVVQVMRFQGGLQCMVFAFPDHLN